MYAFWRAGSFYFEYSHEHRRIRRGGFPTKTLAKLAGEEDRRRRREQRGLVLRPVEQEGVSLRGGDRKRPDQGREAFLERGRQSNVVDFFEATRARQQRRTKGDPR